VALAQRFVAGFVLIINRTFNTNNLCLPLFIIISIINLEKTFPVVLLYCPSESKDSYNFFFQSFKGEAFLSDIQLIKVVVTN
jgi:hypothetical protein